MATMQDGMKTWLKKECTNVLIPRFQIDTVIAHITDDMVNLKPIQILDYYGKVLGGELSEMVKHGTIKESDATGYIQKLRDIVGKYNQSISPNAEPSLYGYVAADELNGIGEDLFFRMLEKMVECQCGKRDMQFKYGQDVHTIRTTTMGKIEALNSDGTYNIRTYGGVLITDVPSGDIAPNPPR